jgi:tetratricopeptide (TPR) repeat protein
MDSKKPHQHVVIILCLVLAAVNLALYGQLQDHEFIHYDDYEYVVENPHLRCGLTLRGITWALTTGYAGNWHPLTWLSHMLDCQLYGLNPKGHHLSSLLLHIINTLLLFLVLKRMTGALWRSAFAAALFAFHPLHVESVAWVSERKDVLSTLFWMMTLWAYVRYVERPAIGRYMLSLLFFFLGLTAKPMLVTLPFVLLLMDYWPLARFQFGTLKEGESLRAGGTPVDTHPWRIAGRLLWEKVPFLVLAASSSVVTFLVQREWGTMPSLIPLKIRAANALYSYALYMGKMIWPQNLAVFYPHPGNTLTLWQWGGAALLLASISLLAVMAARQIPYLIMGWLWYLGTLVPVIGFIQVGSQAMADRYTYVPLIGLFVIISWGVHRLAGKSPLLKGIVSVFAIFAMTGLFVSTMRQVSTWKDGKTLFEHALAVTSRNVLAHNNLGNALAREGKQEEAAYHFAEALRFSPHDATAHNNLGNALVELGRIEEAVAHYTEALRIRPDFKEARDNLLRALQKPPLSKEMDAKQAP